MATFDRWTDEVKQAEDASGYTAALTEHDAAHDENRELRRDIVLMPARTLPGILLKARVVSWCSGGLDEVEDWLTFTIDEGDLSSRGMAIGIARDLVAMVEKQAT